MISIVRKNSPCSIGYSFNSFSLQLVSDIEKKVKKREAEYNPKADRKWINKNKERASYLRSRSSARSFIRNKATEEDLQEFENLIQERRKNL